jgi:hypothetical protein
MLEHIFYVQLLPLPPLPKIMPLWDTWEKTYGKNQTGHGWQYNTAHALFIADT